MDEMFSGGLIDRERLQGCLSGFESRIRRRLRGKLRWIGSGFYDWDDVIASARRRIDHAAVLGRLTIRTEHELLAYFQRVAENVAFDAIRRRSRERHAQSRVARETERHEKSTDWQIEQHDVIASMLRQLDRRDQTALEFTARSSSDAKFTSSRPQFGEAARSRWRRLLERVRASLRIPPPPKEKRKTPAN